MSDLTGKEEGPDRDRPKTEDEGQASRHLSALLSDRSLGKAIVRLVHQVHEESGREFTAETATECLEKLAQISFQQVPCVKTVQMKLNKKPVGSQTKILSYAHNKEEESRQSVVYLDADACVDLNSYLDGFLLKVVSAIQFVLGVRMDGLLLYRLLKNPRQADDVLDEAGIYYTADKDSCSSANPTPGSFVPLCHHKQLDNDFHEFCEGECVAFEVYDPLVVCEDSEDSCPVYIYATVLHEICKCGADTLLAKRYCIDLGLDRGEADISVTRLYKIMDKTTSQMQVYNTSSDNALEQKTATSKEKDEETLDTVVILKDLRETLTKAWQVCKEQEFRCVTKRLALKWHPDRHSASNESACTRLTHAIFRYAELLSQGQKLDQDEDPAGDAERDSVDGQVARFPAKFFASGYGVKAMQEGYGSENPQPGEGRRWLRTAQCDLTTATASRGICQQGRNWVCFLCHQAVEKALKGLLYSRDADQKCLQSHSLPLLARNVGDSPLKEMARHMESGMGPHTRMRYPDVLVYPNVPADVYSDDDVDRACRLARDAVERVQHLMHVW